MATRRWMLVGESANWTRYTVAGYRPAQRLAAARAAGAVLLVYDRFDPENGTFDVRTLPGTRVLYAGLNVAVLRLEPPN